MNKKLLLVSLLSVGMLVGCGGGEEKPSDTTKPSTDPTVEPTVEPSEDPSTEAPQTSEEGEKPNWTGKLGNKGYYLAGEHNAWGDFWKYTGFEKFEFTKVSDDEYTLTFSVSAETLANPEIANSDKNGKDGAIDYKVVYWDGTKPGLEYFPGGVGNNGLITEAGEYKFTFNPNSKEEAQTESGDKYINYTKVTKIGDCNKETEYPRGDKRKFDSKFENVTFKVVLEEGLTLPEGNSVYIHTWGLKNKEDKEVSGYFELTEKNGAWEYTTSEPITVDNGTGEPMTYGFCILVDEPGKTEQNWNKKIANSEDKDGNYSIEVSASKHRGTVQIKKADKPYWTKGEVTNPYTVEEVMKIMDSETYTKYDEFNVTGKVKEATYDTKYKNWVLLLETPEVKPETPAPAAEGETTPAPEVKETVRFKIFSANLDETQPDPEVGDTVVVNGKSNSYTDGDVKVYQVGYAKKHGVHPTILTVEKNELFYLYVRGSLTDWGCKPTHKLVSTAKNVYSVTVELAEGDLFKLANNTEKWDVQFGGAKAKAQLGIAEDIAANFDATDDNIKCLVAGTYTFTYDLTGETPTTLLSK